MSKLLPVILLVGGIYYFSTTVSGEPIEDYTNGDEDGDDFDNGNGNGDDDEEIIPLPGCPPLGDRKEWSIGGISPSYHYQNGDFLNDIKIYEVATNQINYYPGTQVDVTWEAAVKNKSKTRCGEGILGGNKTCWFAPTNGSAIGNYEGPLNWTIYLVGPDGEQYKFKADSGSDLFQGYTDSTVEVAPNCTANECLSDLKGVRAKYQVAFNLDSDAPLGQYAIMFHANYGDEGNFANWNQIGAFSVLSSECNPDTMSAESEKINYETRFASNHDFMLF